MLLKCITWLRLHIVWVCLWTSFNHGVLGGKVGTWKRDGGFVSGGVGHQVPHRLSHS
jgi:hypothetical protein